MERNKCWAVYILRCSDDTLYTGITDDLPKRLKAHNEGKGAKYTRGRGPVTLVYNELCPDKSTALRREYTIKQLTRKEKLSLVDKMLTKISIRPYEQADWDSICAIHDRARMTELIYADLIDAFLPLEIAAEREDLFEYPGLFVALDGETVVGFTACNEEELCWLYVDPDRYHQGIGFQLAQYALNQYPKICCVEVLKGNLPALKLYEKIGFHLDRMISGKMPGNEQFSVEVYSLIK